MQNGFDAVIWLLIIAGIIYAVYAYQNRSIPTKPYAGEGPMKVSITQEEIKTPSISHALEGGRNWWRMHINIQLSERDAELYKRSGLMENELFSYPTKEFPDVLISFTGHSIGMVKHADFPNVQRLEQAKEALIAGLYAVRSRLEAMKHGGTDKESLEI